jgi:hypothetical protein
LTKPSKARRVTIRVGRDRTQSVLDEGMATFPITDFFIQDNGAGFNDQNYTSFRTSDSTLKSNAGGKGIGRFMWLKAFKHVEIESDYCEGESWFRRTFVFEARGEGVHGGETAKPVSSREPLTTVHLADARKDFRAICPKRLETISRAIVDHFITLFLSPDCPQMTVEDDNGEAIRLNTMFKKEYESGGRKAIFQVKGQQFSMASFHMQSRDPSKHRLSFCANNREVFGQSLKQNIPDLAGILNEQDGTAFAYRAFVSGTLLDSQVNSERTDFHIPKDRLPLADPEEVTLPDIEDRALEDIKAELAPLLSAVSEEKLKRVGEFIREKAPQYRHVLKYGKERIAQMPPDLPENGIDLELHKISRDIELEVKQQGQKYLDTDIRNVRLLPEYEINYRQFLAKVNDLGKDSVAQYIVHRKVLLDLLANTLKLAEDDSYSLEQSVHEIIFPLRTTSDDIAYDQHNLWVLDERLAYHYFLASDKRLSHIEPAESNSPSRPDLVIFNNPFAFADQKDWMSSVVVVEFKRPMRNDYTDETNPIKQVYDYIRELRTQRKLDKEGRPVRLGENTPAYVFIVCDLTPKMVNCAVDSGLIPTIDGKGYFGFNTALRCYIEVLSYDKVVSDSQKRSRVLFERLGIN